MKDVCQNPAFILLCIMLFFLCLVLMRRKEIGDKTGGKSQEMFINFWYQNRNMDDLTNLRAEDLLYNPTNLGEYREKMNEQIRKKELNRDFNFEVPRFYKTPYQYLDFQDLIIHDSDKVYNAKPEEISKDFKYTFRTY